MYHEYNKVCEKNSSWYLRSLPKISIRRYLFASVNILQIYPSFLREVLVSRYDTIFHADPRNLFLGIMDLYLELKGNPGRLELLSANPSVKLSTNKATIRLLLVGYIIKWARKCQEPKNLHRSQCCYFHQYVLLSPFIF